ncbi:sodium channel protein Nach-like [Battus philenor]|uniref:sodium channel protein Nach-like n=1 Tax=Battus philenor TaxID=42288 RepID=UPI0035D0DD20
MSRDEMKWHEYNRRKIRRRKNDNDENIFRDIFNKCYREFISNCSITGVKKMKKSNAPLIERVAWIFLSGATFGMFIYFCYYLWFESLFNPFIVTMETSSYPITEIDFPAIAVCNVNRLSKKALKALEMKLFKGLFSKNFTKKSMWNLGRLIDFTRGEGGENQKYLYADDTKLSADKITDTMKELAPRCEEMLLECSWDGEHVDCDSIFEVHRTVRGHCCTFNNVLSLTAAEALNRSVTEVKRQTRPGTSFGLNLVIDPLIEDYAYTTRIVHGLEILVYDSTHFADPSGDRVILRLAEPNTATLLKLNSVKQVATQEVRKYNYRTRNCLFRDERRINFNDTYSYSACIINCRVKAVQALCRCIPYFLPHISEMPTCTLFDLPCLDKYKDKFFSMFPKGMENNNELEIELLDSLRCPHCLVDCEFTKHIAKTIKIPLKGLKTGIQKFPISASINMTNKCYVSIYHSTFYGTLDRLDVVAYWYELVSNVGGVAGILMGLSIISIFEIVYFFCIKFLIRIINWFVFSFVRGLFTIK